MNIARVVTLCVAIGAAAAPAATAQQTRAEAIADAQAEKARQVAPYVPNKAEEIAANMKARLFDTPQGFYPFFDSVYSGGGFTVGAGYRRFVTDQNFVDVRGLFSTKAYKMIEVATSSMGPRRRLEVQAAGGWRDATEVSFYGVGNDTAPEARTNFRLQQAYAGGSARYRAPAHVFADLGLRFENYTLLDGRDGDLPSVDQTFTAATVPGLGANPDYLRTTISGGVDSRSPAADYARRGGLYQATYDIANDVDGGAYSFELLRGEVVQHVPVLRENWVLTFHGVATTTVDDQDTVPYFLLPSLGSGSTLRGYSSWRFRDRHSLLMSGEFRWMPSRLFIDVALFYDAGKVAAHRADLNFEHLNDDWGIGVRFHSGIATPLRIELAHGHEGTKLVFSGAAAF